MAFRDGDAYRDALAAPQLDGFQFYPVTRAMNSPPHNAPDCLKPLPNYERLGGVRTD